MTVTGVTLRKPTWVEIKSEMKTKTMKKMKTKDENKKDLLEQWDECGRRLS